MGCTVSLTSRSVRNLFVSILENQQNQWIFDLLVLFRWVFRILRDTFWTDSEQLTCAAGFGEIVYGLSDVEKCQEPVRFDTRKSRKSADFLLTFFEYLELYLVPWPASKTFTLTLCSNFVATYPFGTCFGYVPVGNCSNVWRVPLLFSSSNEARGLEVVRSTGSWDR